MTITITARRSATDPRLTGLGFMQSDLLIDGLQIGIVLWPRAGYDFGMLAPDDHGRLWFPSGHPGYLPRPYIRFRSAPAKPVDCGYSGIVDAIKAELARDDRANEIAKLLQHDHWASVEGYLDALEGPYTKACCSTTAVRVAIRRLNEASAPKGPSA